MLWYTDLLCTPSVEPQPLEKLEAPWGPYTKGKIHPPNPLFQSASSWRVFKPSNRHLTYHYCINEIKKKSPALSLLPKPKKKHQHPSATLVGDTFFGLQQAAYFPYTPTAPALVAAGKVDCSGVPWKLRCPRPIRKMLSIKAWIVRIAKGWSRSIRKRSLPPVDPPKFKIAPEKWWLEDEFPFGIAYS